MPLCSTEGWCDFCIDFKISKDRRAFKDLSNRLTLRDTKPSTWVVLRLGYLQGTGGLVHPETVFTPLFPVSGSTRKGKIITQGKVSPRTVQDYILVGESKRIPSQKRRAEGTNRKAEAKEHCKCQWHVKYQVWKTVASLFCSVPFLDQEGWIKLRCKMLSSLL